MTIDDLARNDGQSTPIDTNPNIDGNIIAAVAVLLLMVGGCLVGNYNKHEKDTDTTPSEVRKLAESDAHITPVIKPKEGMFGWDVRSGLETAMAPEFLRAALGVIDVMREVAMGALQPLRQKKSPREGARKATRQRLLAARGVLRDAVAVSGLLVGSQLQGVTPVGRH